MVMVRRHGVAWWLLIGWWWWLCFGWWVYPIVWLLGGRRRTITRTVTRPVIQGPSPVDLERAAWMHQQRQWEADDRARRQATAQPIVCRYCQRVSPGGSAACSYCGAS